MDEWSHTQRDNMKVMPSALLKGDRGITDKIISKYKKVNQVSLNCRGFLVCSQSHGHSSDKNSREF